MNAKSLLVANLQDLGLPPPLYHTSSSAGGLFEAQLSFQLLDRSTVTVICTFESKERAENGAAEMAVHDYFTCVGVCHVKTKRF
jgi:hypothetical protein